MATLATVYQYNNFINNKVNNTSVINSNTIDMALTYATTGIESVCKRNLQQQNYNYWYRSDLNYSDFYSNLEGFNSDFYIVGNRPQYAEAYGENIIVLNEYPITKIAIFRADEIGNIKSSAIIANYSVSNTAITLDWWDNNGGNHEQVITFADNPTMSAVQSNVNATSAFTMNIQPPYLNLPSVFLMSKMYGTVSQATQEIVAATNQSPVKFELHDQRKIIANETLEEVLINYTAGYVYPIDLQDHSGLATTGNVPFDLRQACILAASDIISLSQPDILSGISPNLLQSEKLGDYTYERAKGDVGNRLAWSGNWGNIFEKYRYLIDRYINKPL